VIQVFQILHGCYDNFNNISLLPHVDVVTRGKKYKLCQSSVKYDLRKHFFINREVSLWNSLLMVLWTLDSLLLIVLNRQSVIILFVFSYFLLLLYANVTSLYPLLLRCCCVQTMLLPNCWQWLQTKVSMRLLVTCKWRYTTAVLTVRVSCMDSTRVLMTLTMLLHWMVCQVSSQYHRLLRNSK